MNPADWRFLHRHGNKAYRAAIYTSVSIPVNFENALCFVAWQVQGGLSVPLPRRLGEKYLLAMGLVLEFEHVIDPRLARLAYLHWQTLNSASLKEEFVEKQWVQVLVWMRDHSPQLDNNQWRAGWPVIWRKYEQWKQLHQAEDEWDSALGELSLGEWQIVPLTCSYEVALEGMAMKNCVATYAADCLLGEYRLFSIQLAETGQRLATIGLEKQGESWGLEQVKGKHNECATREIRDAALVVSQKYNLAESQLKKMQHPPKPSRIGKCQSQSHPQINMLEQSLDSNLDELMHYCHACGVSITYCRCQ